MVRQSLGRAAGQTDADPAALKHTRHTQQHSLHPHSRSLHLVILRVMQELRNCDKRSGRGF